MPFVPFDGVLLDDPREPIPGALALLLHLQVEQARAAAARREPLARPAVEARARACRDLLAQGLLPDQLRELGLPLGRPGDPDSLASLADHLEGYLGAVEASGHVEPMAALWTAARRQEAGDRGLWVERTAEDGPLDACLEDLAPARLRALLALPGVPVRFRLSARRGTGARGLFEGQEPHLVRDLLPGLERLGAALDRFSLEAPEGWAVNPWGAALDGLFQGPLDLDPDGAAGLQRALLPTGAAVLRAAVEQVCAWVDEGLAPGDITLFHPAAERVAPLLDGLLQAEGLGLHALPGRRLVESPAWAPLLALLEGIALGDPDRLATGLAAVRAAEPLGRACRAFAQALGRCDEAGPEAVAAVLAGLDSASRAALGARWKRASDLPRQPRTRTAWLGELETLVLGFGFATEDPDFHPALGLLGQAWAGQAGKLAFPDLLEELKAFLDTGTAAPPDLERDGVRLLHPSALLHGWRGSRATLLLDLGEGAWPAAPALPPDLDEVRRARINAALRSRPQEGAFPPALQAFALSRAEADEALPRAFHAEAFAFNAALALTRERLVALSADQDAEGRRRAQGPFWRALEGAGGWAPSPVRCASWLRRRWLAGEADALERSRQTCLRVQDPEALPALSTAVPEPDQVPGVWRKGGSPEHAISPTTVEGLARCPFRVFAQHCLRLEASSAGPTAPLPLGSAVHSLLQGLLKDLHESGHWPAAFLARHGLPGASAPDLEGLLEAVWAHQGPAILERLDLDPAATGVVGRAVAELLPGLAAVLAWDLAQAEPQPQEREAFNLRGAGPWTRRLEGVEQVLGPVAFLAPPRWFEGRVDRLERWTCGGESFLRILDYKTSRPEVLKRYGDHDGWTAAHLQLPLYQRMAEVLHGCPVSAWLLPLREFNGLVPAFFAPGDEASRSRLEAHLAELLGRAEAGVFPAVPGEACGTCSLSSLCGRPVDLDAPAGTEGEEP
jgi:hypothetical protein